MVTILCGFVSFVQVANLKLFSQFCKSKQKQLHLGDLDKTRKSTKNQSSYFDSIEETMDPSCILLAGLN